MKKKLIKKKRTKQEITDKSENIEKFIEGEKKIREDEKIKIRWNLIDGLLRHVKGH